MPQYVIDTLKPKNNNNFPVAEAVDVLYEEGSTVKDKIIAINALIVAAQQLIEGIQTDISELQSGKVDKVSGKGLSTNDFTNAYRDKIDDTYTKSETDTALAGKVDKVSGKGLSTNDFTNTYKNKVDNTYTKTETDSAIAGKIAEVVAEAPESLDTLKEIADWIDTHADSASAMNSAIQANAANIEKKVDKVEGKTLSSNDFTDVYKNKVDNTYTKTETDTALAGKVDKVSGKDLSTNDFTTAYKDKIDDTYTKSESDSITSAISARVAENESDISQLQTDVASKASTSALTETNNTVATNKANLQSQIDTLVLESGGDSNLEVVQARTGSDGTAHNTLKARLDAMDEKNSLELSVLNRDLGYATDYTNVYDSSTNSVGFLKDDGTVYNNSDASKNYFTTNYIDVGIANGVVVKFNTLPSDNLIRVCWYDSTKTFISAEGRLMITTTTADKTYKMVAPANSKYVRISLINDCVINFLSNQKTTAYDRISRETIDFSRVKIYEKTISGSEEGYTVKKFEPLKIHAGATYYATVKFNSITPDYVETQDVFDISGSLTESSDTLTERFTTITRADYRENGSYTFMFTPTKNAEYLYYYIHREGPYSVDVTVSICKSDHLALETHGLDSISDTINEITEYDDIYDSESNAVGYLNKDGTVYNSNEASNNYFTTKYIDAPVGIVIKFNTLPSDELIRVGWYDSDKVFVGRQFATASSVDKRYVLTAPSGASLARISLVSDCVIDYISNKKPSAIDKVSREYVDFSKVKIFDETIEINNGVYVFRKFMPLKTYAGATYYITVKFNRFTPVEYSDPRDVFDISGATTESVDTVTERFATITRTEYRKNGEYTFMFTPTMNAKYLYFYSCKNGDVECSIDVDISINKSDLLTLTKDNVYPTIKLYGIGDSLMVHDYFMAHLRDKYNVEYTSFAEGSTGYSTNNNVATKTTYYDRVAQMPAEAPDIILVEGGTNDFGKNKTIEDTKNGVRQTITNLYNKYPYTMIVSVLPAQRNYSGTAEAVRGMTNDIGVDLIEYVDAIKSVYDEYGIKTIDLYRESGLNMLNVALLTTDGLHWTEEFHRHIADIIYPIIKQYGVKYRTQTQS